MKRLIQRLPFAAEFSIVIIFCFGYSIYSSVTIFVRYLFHPTVGELHFNNSALIGLLFDEIIILILVLIFLKLRNNSVNFKNNLDPLDLLLITIALIVCYYLIYFLILFIVDTIVINANFSSLFLAKINRNINFPLAAVTSLVNGLFEESIVVGYVIPALSARKSIIYAVNVSVLIRLLYHLYQGPIAALSIVPLGLLFAFVFVKTKNLWPLVAAHAVFDFVGIILH